MIRIGVAVLASGAWLGFMAAPVWAQANKDGRPEVLLRLIACREVTEASARLACFDMHSAALDQAERQRDVVVVDRGQIRKARRSLFGLDLPDFTLFGEGRKDRNEVKAASDEEGISRLESTIKQASQGPTGRWTLVIEDGARWLQIDAREPSHLPKTGMPIVIRRATMGSYLASIDKQIAIRVKRVN